MFGLNTAKTIMAPPQFQQWDKFDPKINNGTASNYGKSHSFFFHFW